MRSDSTFQARDGRQIGFADYGPEGGTPVLWCHGGPGSRYEPAWIVPDAVAAGLRIIAIDRPGYGLSTPHPGRTIADGADDVLQLADHVSVDRFVSVGVSTGGAYALATACRAPERVRGVVMCCAVTDMSWAPGRATMHGPQVHAVWDAPDRDAAIAAAIDAYGDGFGKLLDGGMATVLAPSDAEIFTDPAWMAAAMHGFPAMSTHGMQGYADDRRADGRGWVDFDVDATQCPVTVLHGTDDLLTTALHARHTADVVPHARLVLIENAGHFSIERHIVEQIRALLTRSR
ncbi:MAG TPA: alpha/beta hydrolase, partial [Acidimicrobiia bacterium]|nr:alpha/beta hydrolase [Acidimicrobiia bacterium]